MPFEAYQSLNRVNNFDETMFASFKELGLFKDEEQDLSPFRTRRGIGFVLEQI